MDPSIKHARAPAMIRLGDKVVNRFFISQHHLWGVYHFLPILF